CHDDLLRQFKRKRTSATYGVSRIRANGYRKSAGAARHVYQVIGPALDLSLVSRILIEPAVAVD
ncbi:MAG: hypothetical protein ACXW6K_08380, partial [Candidatus Binatia bacterium]